MKTLIKNPKLKTQSANDGVWLHFSTSDGKHVSLNLHTQDRGGIIGKALEAWAREYATCDAGEKN